MIHRGGATGPPGSGTDALLERRPRRDFAVRPPSLRRVAAVGKTYGRGDAGNSCRQSDDSVHADGYARTGRQTVAQRFEKTLIQRWFMTTAVMSLREISVEPVSLFGDIGEFSEAIGEFDAAAERLKPSSDRRLLGFDSGQCRLACWKVINNRDRVRLEPRDDRLAQCEVE